MFDVLMSPYDFSQLSQSLDAEAATHRVFDQAYGKWISDGADALTVGELTVYCVETTFSEVCNGGIAQYLGNESGQLAKYCPDALVGLDEYAKIIEEALRRCECKLLDGQIDDDDPRAPWIDWTLLDTNHYDPFDDLERRFFDRYFSDKTEFRRKLFQYITEHDSEFVSL